MSGPVEEGRANARHRIREGLYLRRFALLVVSTLLSLLAVEAAVRWIAPQQLIQLRPDIWQPHDGLGWERAPNLDVEINTGERTARLLTDSRGHRVGSHAPKREPAYRILALGDSFIEALQVDYEDTVTARISDLLEDDLDVPVEVVNTGVAGWDPNHYLLRLLAEFEQTSYNAAVVFLYAANDLIEEEKNYFPPRPSRRSSRLRIPRSLAKAELSRALLLPLNNALETRSHAFVLAKNRAWVARMRLGLSPRYLSSAFARSERDSYRWSLTARRCARIARDARAHGVPTVFVILPTVYQIDPMVGAAYRRGAGSADDEIDYGQVTEILVPALRELELEVVDLTPVFRHAFADGKRELYGSVDPHLSPAGHALTAETVAPLLRDLLVGRKSSDP